MRPLARYPLLFLMAIPAAFLAGCTPGAQGNPAPSGTAPAPAAASQTAPTGTPTPPLRDLAETGPYTAAARDLTFVDESRDGRELAMTLWVPGDPAGGGVPYPVVLYSHGYGGHRKESAGLASHLASHGFVVAAVEHGDADESSLLADRPLDIIALHGHLEQLAAGQFAGLFDLERVGMMGLSMGAATSLQMAGAGVDAPHLESWCPDHPAAFPCRISPASRRQAEEALAQVAVAGENGLGTIAHDLSIRSIALLAPGMSPVFGPRGLAAVTTPTLILAPTADEIVSYQDETVPLFHNLVAAEPTLVSFVGARHGSLLLPDARRDALVTAFFAATLQARPGAAPYLTERYVRGVEGLAWGVYSGD